MGWTDIGEDGLKAAKMLFSAGHYRSAMSRAYFAAYARAAAEFSASDFGLDRSNPTHAQIITLVRHNLKPRRFSNPERREVAGLLRNLQRSRLSADYEADTVISRTAALDSVRGAARVFASLEAAP